MYLDGKMRCGESSRAWWIRWHFHASEGRVVCQHRWNLEMNDWLMCCVPRCERHCYGIVGHTKSVVFTLNVAFLIKLGARS